MKEFCIHYPSGGMAMNRVCEKDVVMKTTINEDDEAPCYNDRVHTCPFAEYPTAEQIAERNKEIGKMLENLVLFMQHKSNTCPHCSRQVTALEQAGRCVYARPCGCRLWQGKVPKEWKTP